MFGQEVHEWFDEHQQYRGSWFTLEAGFVPSHVSQVSPVLLK